MVATLHARRSAVPEGRRAARANRGGAVSSALRHRIAACAAHPDLVLFLDIETTGLSHHYDDITITGWSFDGRARTIVSGQSVERLREDAARASSLVTFNGIRFDSKFLARKHPDIRLPEIHVDLMYLCRRVGLTGGQKAIEKELNLNFRGGLEDMDGAGAVVLWHRYVRGDRNALKKLIRYNKADIAAMGAILDNVLSRLDPIHDFFIDADRPRFQEWSAPPGWRALPEISPPPAKLTEGSPRFADLFGADDTAGLRVVGIDLTGSEKRASGWCLLHGAKADVATIFSDNDLIAKTLDARPQIVSIDSPLCLPAGRKSVEDDDPGREEFGIMRRSERVLKRRGINVYPCLIRSMQNLTARGIRIARELRERGVPVIESYPGAAQDIMRIPRKGAGAEWLKAGLREFGVSGDYVDGDVTHDELDAITSALVGVFHMAGMSEALGTDKEAPLIVPQLQRRAAPLVIGVSGPIAAGKTTLARALERRGFAYTRFSLVIDDMLAQEGLPPTRANRQTLGERINRSGGQRELGERTVARVGPAKKIVVDGLRFPDDGAYLVERFGLGFRHVHIHADTETRRARYERRHGSAGFDAASRAGVEGRVSELRSLAHDVFDNRGSMPRLENYADSLASRHPEGFAPCPSPS